MIVYKDQGINWHPQSDSLGVSPLKWTQSTHTFVSGLCHLVESLRQLTCFIGCFILGLDGSFKLGSRKLVFLDKVPVNAGDVSTTVYKGVGVDGFHGV